MTTVRRVAIVQNQMAVDGRSRYVGQVILALNALGIVPDLFTLTSETATRQWAQIQFAGSVPEFALARGFRLPYRRGYIYQAIAHNWLVRRALTSYDVTINSNDFLGFLPRQGKRIHIIYFPLQATFAVTPRHRRLLWRLIGLPARALARAFDGVPMGSDIMLPISRYTARYAEQVWPGASMRLLYPPVAIWSKDPATVRDIDVISLGSLSPDKRQLEQVQLAAAMPSLRFVIVGSTSSRRYARKVRTRIRELGLTNIRITENATEDHVHALLGRSRIFLHLKEGEHFGISVAQAIARGCIPLVSDSGGLPEIVPNPNLRFSRIEELPDKIARAMNGTLVSKDALGSLQVHVSRFADAHFQQDMKLVLTAALEHLEHESPKLEYPI